MDSELSSNWQALQQSWKQKSKRTSRKKEQSQTRKKPILEQSKSNTEKPEDLQPQNEEVLNDEETLKNIVLKVLAGRRKDKTKNLHVNLLEWAEDNDISLADLESAYGKDEIYKTYLARDKTKSSSGRLIASLTGTGSEKFSAIQKWWTRPVNIDETRTDIGKYIALDCEFVGVGPNGSRNALARVSIVNYFGAVILDEFVQPEERVTDWRTWISGVSPKDMTNAKSFREVQYKVAEILKDRILIGHAIQNDLKILMVSHPRRLIYDTSRLAKFRAISKGHAPSLKNVAKEFLDLEIQADQHSSVEDARACILLFRRFKNEFEKSALSKRAHKANEEESKNLVPASDV
ncbi:ribonuclease H-like domain-containing protein [Lipomyces oligophaga]|uniref:ribonuclease H-like domain-containing protein n=1 Tax=Lipomyces oligophaga TaxID=45792 RepID=UPI0034CD444B